MKKVFPSNSLQIPKQQSSMQLGNQQFRSQQLSPNENGALQNAGQSSFSTSITKFKADQFDQKAIVLCQFCGGEKCEQQDYTKNKIQPNAIEGLHSNWITEDILAMQRPSQRLIKNFNIYKRFKEIKINTILNLQQPGQHPYCGDGIIGKVGFSYIPQGFFSQGIHFFNEHWEDMTATTFQHMMKIMNIFDHSITKNKGRIAVHCHAGRGRTLLVICSWLIYNERMNSAATIELAVKKRQGVLTRGSQRQFLHDFQKELQERWKNFETQYKQNFNSFVQWQTVSLLKRYKNQARWTPYLHAKIMEVLRARMKIQSLEISKAFLNPNDPIFKQKWTVHNDQKLVYLKKETNSFKTQAYQRLNLIETRVLIQLLFDFYDQMPYTVITCHTMDDIVFEQLKEGQILNQMEILSKPAIVHDLGIHGIAVILDFLNFINAISRFLLDKDPKMIQLIFLRLAFLLFTKKKYNPKIFNVKQRSCFIEEQKRHKYINTKIIGLSKFLRNLASQVPEKFDNIEELVLKFRKVDANIYYFTQQHRKGSTTISKQHATDIYTKSQLSQYKSKTSSKSRQGQIKKQNIEVEQQNFLFQQSNMQFNE